MEVHNPLPSQWGSTIALKRRSLSICRRAAPAGRATGKIFRRRLADARWSPLTPGGVGPSPRTGAALAAADGAIWVHGGADQDGTEHTIDVFDLCRRYSIVVVVCVWGGESCRGGYGMAIRLCRGCCR